MSRTHWIPLRLPLTPGFQRCGAYAQSLLFSLWCAQNLHGPCLDDDLQVKAVCARPEKPNVVRKWLQQLKENELIDFVEGFIVLLDPTPRPRRDASEEGAGGASKGAARAPRRTRSKSDPAPRQGRPYSDPAPTLSRGESDPAPHAPNENGDLGDLWGRDKEYEKEKDQDPSAYADGGGRACAREGPPPPDAPVGAPGPGVGWEHTAAAELVEAAREASATGTRFRIDSDTARRAIPAVRACGSLPEARAAIRDFAGQHSRRPKRASKFEQDPVMLFNRVIDQREAIGKRPGGREEANGRAHAAAAVLGDADRNGIAADDPRMQF